MLESAKIKNLKVIFEQNKEDCDTDVFNILLANFIATFSQIGLRLDNSEETKEHVKRNGDGK